MDRMANLDILTLNVRASKNIIKNSGNSINFGGDRAKR